MCSLTMVDSSHVLPVAVHLNIFFDKQVGGPQDFSVHPRPLGIYLGFGLGWTWLGLGLAGFGTKIWGQGLTICF